jgi:hypothetical protein
MPEEEAHLWRHQEDGTLVLDPRLVDRKDFAVEEIGACIFIHPKRDKWDWSEDELRLRSVAVDLQGRVISTGWPKFFNMGERPANDAALELALESGEEVFFTEKLDGTLIVRSVLPNGKVIFRTRGRWESDEFGPLAHAIASARYPALLDPRIMPEWSLLFEYVGPANLIVIAYSQEDLVFLGAVRHADFHLMPVEQMQTFARNYGLRCVPLVELPRDVKGMVEAVRGWENREGIVVRLHRGQLLIKLKSARYLAMHAMRANMSYDLIVEYARQAKITTVEELELGLRELGYDYEMTQIARMHFSLYQEQHARSEAVLATARQLHAEFLAQANDPTNPPISERERRKRYAMQAARQRDPLRNVLFALYDGREERAQAALFRWYVVEQRQ